MRCDECKHASDGFGGLVCDLITNADEECGKTYAVGVSWDGNCGAVLHVAPDFYCAMFWPRRKDDLVRTVKFRMGVLNVLLDELRFYGVLAVDIDEIRQYIQLSIGELIQEVEGRPPQGVDDR